ncbi:MAG: hypothetical protein H7X97_00715 [Opitutaceae bacterium]|nr:hypothetical protein [Verrucomicrobiales bacterium]
MSNTNHTPESVENMTAAEASQIGVQQYRDGKTFAAGNVRPAGFFMACLAAKRLDLVEALDRGWHVANLAEPIKFEDGTVMGSSPASHDLEAICNA